METRVLTEADAETYAAIRIRALREHPEAFGRTAEEVEPLDVLRARLREPGADFILGAFDPEIVGTVGCFREREAKRRHIAVIWGMYVAPERRGRGVSRRLLTDAIGRARDWPGLDQIRLSVVNAPARALYASCGFEPWGLEPRALKVGDRYYDEHHMVLRLR